MDLDNIIINYSKPTFEDKKINLSTYIIIRIISIIIIIAIIMHYIVMRDNDMLCKHKSILFLAMLVVFDVVMDTINSVNN